jgi:cell wall assembly regulator SMI1
MSVSDEEWSFCGPPVTKERIHEVQQNLGVRFPEQFLDWVGICDGGLKKHNAFDFVHPSDGKVESDGMGFLYSFREPMDRYLKDIYRNDPDLWRDMDIRPWWTIEDINLLERAEHFPEGLIAFADNGSGDHICFDYRSDKNNPSPTIVIWLHEFWPDSAGFIAKDFDAFAASLRSDAA